MKKMSYVVVLLFLLIFPFTNVAGLSYATLNPGTLDLTKEGESTLALVSTVDGVIESGSFTIYTTSKHIFFQAITFVEGVQNTVEGSKVTFKSKVGFNKGDTIATVKVKASAAAPIGAKGNIIINDVKFTVDGAKKELDNAISTITVVDEKPKSNDNTLKKLSSVISPIEFKTDVKEYSVTVPNSISKFDLQAEVNHEKASMKISSQNLVDGDNAITITVKAENGEESIYKVHVKREVLQDTEKVSKGGTQTYMIIVFIVSLLIIIGDIAYMLRKK